MRALHVVLWSRLRQWSWDARTVTAERNRCRFVGVCDVPPDVVHERAFRYAIGYDNAALWLLDWCYEVRHTVR